MSIFGDFENWLNSGGGNTINSALGLAGGAYSIDQGLAAADRMENLGNYLNDYAATQGGALNANSAFKGYGVTSSLGRSNIGGDGGLSLNVGQDNIFSNSGDALRNDGTGMMQSGGQAFNTALANYAGYNPASATQQAMQRAMTNPAAREQYFYDRQMAMQAPELDRQQMVQQAREYAMGRGGVRGTQYGGTAEDAAMARA